MSRTRRQFLHTSAGVAAGLASGTPALMAQARGNRNPLDSISDSQIKIPRVRFGKVNVSRLILGVNPFYGFGHGNSVFNTLMRDWYTAGKVVEECSADVASIGVLLIRLGDPQGSHGLGISADRLYIPSLGTEVTAFHYGPYEGFGASGSHFGFHGEEEKVKKLSAAYDSLIDRIKAEGIDLEDLRDKPAPPAMTREEREADRKRRYELEWGISAKQETYIKHEPEGATSNYLTGAREAFVDQPNPNDPRERPSLRKDGE